MKLLRFIKDDKAQAGNILGLVGVLIGLAVLVALGGLVASQITGASALPEGDAFNVSTQTTEYFGLTTEMAYIAVFAAIGMVVLGMVLGYFIYQGRQGR
jgi:hypothetical protein